MPDATWLPSGVRSALLAGPVLIIAACRPPPPAYAPPPPPEVTVTRPVSRMVPETLEFTGTTRAADQVEIRARVRGFLKEKRVEAGQRVSANDVLFVIDPTEYEIAVAQATSEVAAAEAERRLAEINHRKLQEALETLAASRYEVDTAEAQLAATAAQVALAQAKLKAAETNLGYCTMRAPISGRLGFVPVDAGNLVGLNEATLLATIVNDERVYATYDIDEPTLLRLRREAENRRPGEDGRANLVVRLALQDEEGYPHVGSFCMGDNKVDPQTGTIRVESVFENPNGTLLPGLFARVQAEFGERPALLVPDVAVLTDQGGRHVLVVNDHNTVERRPVKAGPLLERMRRIDDGLEPQAWVIVSGVQRAVPGARVKAERREPGAAGAVATQPGAAVTRGSP